MVIAPAAAPPWGTGTGNSPPTRKLASLPLVATRFGSARICKTPLLSKSLIVAARFKSGRNAKIFRASARLNAVLVPVVLPGIVPVKLEGLPLGNCDVVITPGVLAAPVESRFTPNDF